ncbi:MAG: cupin domain-containing protein [Bilophila wadsworthia]
MEHVPGRPEHVLTAIRSPMSGGMPSIPRGKCTRAWDCRAGAFELPCHASTELCVITEGSAEIEDAQGRKTLVKPGDAFIIPQGSRTVWRIEEYVKKYYLCVLDLED